MAEESVLYIFLERGWREEEEEEERKVLILSATVAPLPPDRTCSS